jgi:hypothetical protein
MDAFRVPFAFWVGDAFLIFVLLKCESKRPFKRHVTVVNVSLALF